MNELGESSRLTPVSSTTDTSKSTSPPPLQFSGLVPGTTFFGPQTQLSFP